MLLSPNHRLADGNSKRLPQSTSRRTSTKAKWRVDMGASYPPAGRLRTRGKKALLGPIKLPRLHGHGILSVIGRGIRSFFFFLPVFALARFFFYLFLCLSSKPLACCWCWLRCRYGKTVIRRPRAPGTNAFLISEYIL